MDGWSLIIKSFYEFMKDDGEVKCVEYKMEMHFEELQDVLSFINLHSEHCIEFCEYEINKA